MTRAKPQTRVNIKYNHTDSKTTYLVRSLSCCHKYILNKVRFCHLKSKSTNVSQ